jgi:hypothetical protein
MNDIEITIVIAFLSYFFNMMNIHYEINPYTFILFINLCGLYHIYRNLHVNITIRYGD